LTESSLKGGASYAAFAESAPRPLIDSRLRPELAKWDARPRAFGEADVDHPVVQISPPDLVRHRAVPWHGVPAESVQCTSWDKVEYRFSAPAHLLVAYEKGERWSGETFIGGEPPSSLRSFGRGLTFIPAGHGYCAQTSRALPVEPRDP
jgi:hypothetical protein